jgi:hypothetical protein
VRAAISVLDRFGRKEDRPSGRRRVFGRKEACVRKEGGRTFWKEACVRKEGGRTFWKEA